MRIEVPILTGNRPDPVARQRATLAARAKQDAADRAARAAAQRAVISRLMEGPAPRFDRIPVAAHDVVTRERAGWSRLVVIVKAGKETVARHDQLEQWRAKGYSLVRQVIVPEDLP